MPGDIVREYVQSFRRSGQSCISRIFGLSPKDLDEPESSTSKLYDPVTAAYAAVAKDQIGAESAIQTTASTSSRPTQSGPLPRTEEDLPFVVGSVERRLRLGTIAGSSEAGAHDEQMQRRRIITAGELRRIISAGLARTLMQQAGAENEEEVAQASSALDRVQDILQECPDSTPIRCPTPKELLDPTCNPTSSGLDEIRAEQEDALGIDEGCMRAAVRSLKMPSSRRARASFVSTGSRRRSFRRRPSCRAPTATPRSAARHVCSVELRALQSAALPQVRGGGHEAAQAQASDAACAASRSER